MTNHGFLRIGLGTPAVQVGNVFHNAKEIQTIMEQAKEEKVDILLFPELSLTAYTCGDLFFQQKLLKDAELALEKLMDASRKKRFLCMLGLPIAVGGKLYNTVAVFSEGKLLGIVPKTYLLNHGQNVEGRYFASGFDVRQTELTLCGQIVPFGTDLLFTAREFPELTIGLEIGSDLWAHVPPSSIQSALGATVLCNIAAQAEEVGESIKRRALVKYQSVRQVATYAYCGAGVSESTTDTVFSGQDLVYTCGEKNLESGRFEQGSKFQFCDVDVEQIAATRLKNSMFSRLPQAVVGSVRHIPFSLTREKRELCAKIAQNPFLPAGKTDKYFAEVLEMQAVALVKRFAVTNAKTAVIGVSGGLDSAFALLTTCLAFDKIQKPRTDILAVTMPGFGTTARSHKLACDLMCALGVSQREISIVDSVNLHLKDIAHEVTIQDITYENAQARERTQILMDLANKEDGLVIGTGNLSELALGFSTFGGDHLSMYAINAGIPKTMLQEIAAWLMKTKQFGKEVSEMLQKILEMPISPELLPSDGEEITQKTEEIVGPYILHDFFLYYTIQYGYTAEKIRYLAKHAFAERFDEATIEKWQAVFLKRFYSAQFKRNCMSDTPKICALSLSSRTDARYPSDMEFYTGE